SGFAMPEEWRSLPESSPLRLIRPARQLEALKPQKPQRRSTRDDATPQIRIPRKTEHTGDAAASRAVRGRHGDEMPTQEKAGKGTITREKLVELLNEDLSREYQAIIAYVNYSKV